MAPKYRALILIGVIAVGLVVFHPFGVSGYERRWAATFARHWNAAGRDSPKVPTRGAVSR